LGHRSNESAARPKPAAGRRAKRGTVTLAILQTLKAKGPIKPAELARIAGAKPTTVSVALDNFRKKSLVTRSNAGWTLTTKGRAELARRQSAG
jgi:DNA-binding MarR family transcriptional regulator